MTRLLPLAVLLLVAAPAAVVDLREKRIPDRLVFPGLAAMAAVRLFVTRDLSAWSLLEAGCGFGLIAAIRALSGGRIGLGDAKLSAFLALGLGLAGWLLALLVASLGGLLVAGAGLLCGRLNRRESIPFAPFLAAGGLAGWLLQDRLAGLLESGLPGAGLGGL